MNNADATDSQPPAFVDTLGFDMVLAVLVAFPGLVVTAGFLLAFDTYFVALPDVVLNGASTTAALALWLVALWLLRRR